MCTPKASNLEFLLNLHHLPTVAWFCLFLFWMFPPGWLFLSLVCSRVVFKKSFFSLLCQRKIKAESLHLPWLVDWHFVLLVPTVCKEKYLNTSNWNVNLFLLKNIFGKKKIILRYFWGRIWANQTYLIFFGRDCKFCLGLLWLRMVWDGLHPHLSVKALQS